MSDKKSFVSIVIPHWNNVDVLSECLESISNTNFENFETIVVDNASTDNSVASVRSNYPNVKLIENTKIKEITIIFLQVLIIILFPPQYK